MSTPSASAGAAERRGRAVTSAFLLLQLCATALAFVDAWRTIGPVRAVLGVAVVPVLEVRALRRAYAAHNWPAAVVLGAAFASLVAYALWARARRARRSLRPAA